MAKNTPYANPVSTGNDALDYFLNPLGALTDNALTGQAYAEDNGDGTVSTYGKLGKKRHTGVFSPNNPYVANMMAATSNQDQDALYELAVKWEADYANTQEERAYNSPEAQLARERAAGINSDIAAAGGSAGASGVTATGSAIPQQQGQTKFSNTYDEVGLTLQGIQTAASLVSSFAGGYGAIAQGISTLAMIPAQQALNQSQAGLADAQANEINTLLDGRKKSLDLANQSNWLNQVSHISQNLLKPNFTDEEATNLFNTMGYDKSMHPQLIESVRGIHNNPAILAQYNEDQKRARVARFANELATDEYVKRMISLTQATELSQLQFDYAHTTLMSSVESALLSNEDYVNNLVETTLNDASTNKTISATTLERALHDADAWTQLFVNKAEMLKEAEGILKSIYDSAIKDGIVTEAERANYQAARTEYFTMYSSLSNEFNKVRVGFLNIARKRYEAAKFMDSSGNEVNKDFLGTVTNFSTVTFDNVYHNLPSTGEVVRGWIGTAAGAVGDLMFGTGMLMPQLPKSTRSIGYGKYGTK